MRFQAPIRGMHCAGCVRTIENGLRTLPGLRAATVNFAAESGDFEIDPDRFQAAELQERLRRLGFRLQSRRLLYRLPGLDPSGIVALESRLRALPGIIAAGANAQTSSVAVDVVGDADVEGLLRREGFTPQEDSVDGRDTELRNLAWRAGLSLAVSAVLMALMLLHAGSHALWGLLAAPVVLWGGWPFHAGLWRALRHGRADMNVLVSLGSLTAFLSGPFVEMPYYDAAAMIVAVILLGRTLELRARRGSRRAVEALLELAPRSDLKPGDETPVKPGERFPADGVVLEGTGTADESMITGESRPVDKGPGSRVIGGALNGPRPLRIRVERGRDDGILAQIVALVRRAQSGKPASQRLADLWAARFVPLVLAVAALTGLAWWAIDPSRILETGVAVLVVACPCAFGLAAPMAVLVAGARGASLGLLFKDAVALENAARLRRMIFDKTGTLTRGRPELVSVRPCAQLPPEELLRAAAAIERDSEHPLAAAVTAAAADPPTATDVEARPGLGIQGKVEGRELFIGNRAFMDTLGIDLSPIREAADAESALGRTLIFVADAKAPLGLIAVADAPRPESKEVLRRLSERGLSLTMLTGDDAVTAAAIGRDLGLQDVRAGVRPSDKAAVVASLQAEGPVGMVGDGINDGPALAQADVGFAVQQGNDVAIESADVVLMRNDLGAVVAAIDLSRATRRVIHQNFAWAIGYNAVLIPLAAGMLAPWGLRLHPLAAAAAMALSSLSVVANSLRLRRAGA
jgi:Cu+-exporting ATPase